MPRPSRTIAVFFHENDRKRLRSYAVTYLSEFWRQDGNRVRYVFGVRKQTSADLLLIHVDLSVVPDEYLDFARRYPIVLNGAARDIRKSVISTNLLCPGDSHPGGVIVKSNLNDCGAPERSLRAAPAWRRRLRKALRRRADEDPAFPTPLDYRIYDRLSEVPRSDFGREDRVVEKFLPEAEGDLFFVRHYECLGDRSTCTRLAARHPIVKDQTVVRCEDVEPHPEIVETRKRLGFDYGKFDYTVHDGRPVLLDANKTTGADRLSTRELDVRRRRRADGIYSYFR